MSSSKIFLFLNWNLFLASIPYLATTLVSVYPEIKTNKIILVAILFIWLLFFPNAPYILTDLYHLKPHTSAPLWFDLLLILSFAWTGLILGFLSLRDIETMLRLRYNYILSTLIVITLIFAGSFGVYIGRYLRWNSWDLIQDPINIIYDVTNRFIDPFAHPRTWGVTILLGTLLNFMYWSIRQCCK